jgi:hypothetical protein
MEKHDDQKKKGEVRLVKVNSAGEDSRRFDAYGYEIPPEKRERPAASASAGNAGTVEDHISDGSDAGFEERPSRKYTYNADIRAAIESGAHRRKADEFDERTSGSTAVRDNGASERRQYSGERSGTGASGSGAGGTNGSGSSGSERRKTPSRTSHVASVRSENGEKSGEGRKSASGASGSGTRSGSGSSGKAVRKNTDNAAAKKKTASKKAESERARKKREKEAKKEAERQEAERLREEEENRELTPTEKRKLIVRQKRRDTVAGIFKVLAVILIIGLIIALIAVSSKKGDDINTQYLSSGYIEDAASGKLSFIRTETPVYSSFSGVFVPDVNEGDRVSKNAVIGHVVKAEYSDTLKELKDVESRISAALKASSYIDASKSGEMLSLENAIENRIDDLAALAMSGGLTGYDNIFSELSDLFSRKNELEMSAESSDTYITGLQRERNSILNRISSYMYEIHASESGIVSFRTDGMEGRVSEIKKALASRIEATNFTSVQSSTLSSAEYESFALPASEITNSSGQSVSNGSIVARIATENSYYVTMEVEDPESHRIFQGNKAEIYVNGDNLLFEADTEGVFYYGNKAVAVFRVSRSLDSTVSLRSEEGRIIFSHVEGFKVPLRALTDWDSAGVTARITLIRSGYVRYAYVNVLGADSDYAIVNSRSTLDDGSGYYVRENDEYVVNFDKVYEGQAVG